MKDAVTVTAAHLDDLRGKRSQEETPRNKITENNWSLDLWTVLLPEFIRERAGNGEFWRSFVSIEILPPWKKSIFLYCLIFSTYSRTRQTFFLFGKIAKQLLPGLCSFACLLTAKVKNNSVRRSGSFSSSRLSEVWRRRKPDWWTASLQVPEVGTRIQRAGKLCIRCQSLHKCNDSH